MLVGLCSVWKQRLLGGMLALNPARQTQMMPNTQITKIRHLSWKTPKNSTNTLANRKWKLREIAEELKISEGCVFIILHEHLSMRNLCSKWGPSLLSVDQKQQRVDDSERCLQLFQNNKRSFCVNI